MYSNKREYSKFVFCFLRSRNQNRILLLLRAIEQNTKGGIIVKKYTDFNRQTGYSYTFCVVFRRDAFKIYELSGCAA